MDGWKKDKRNDPDVVIREFENTSFSFHSIVSPSSFFSSPLSLDKEKVPSFFFNFLPSFHPFVPSSFIHFISSSLALMPRALIIFHPFFLSPTRSKARM